MTHHDERLTVFELRRYTTRPGGRDVLIELFERALLEPQERAGMRVLGQFRDDADADRFVWIRGFADLHVRHEALTAFYGGELWARHRDAANATMIDSDDVLLLRPVGSGCFERTRDAQRRTPGAYVVTIAERRSVPPADHDGVLVAMLETEATPNSFPRLPVRTDLDVRVAFHRFDDAQDARRFAAGAPQHEHHVLHPTARSHLR